MFFRDTVVPFGRIQHIDVELGTDRPPLRPCNLDRAHRGEPQQHRYVAGIAPCRCSGYARSDPLCNPAGSDLTDEAVPDALATPVEPQGDEGERLHVLGLFVGFVTGLPYLPDLCRFLRNKEATIPLISIAAVSAILLFSLFLPLVVLDAVPVS